MAKVRNRSGTQRVWPCAPPRARRASARARLTVVVPVLAPPREPADVVTLVVSDDGVVTPERDARFEQPVFPFTDDGPPASRPWTTVSNGRFDIRVRNHTGSRLTCALDPPRCDGRRVVALRHRGPAHPGPRPIGARAFTVDCEDQRIEADAVVLAGPAHDSADLIRDFSPAVAALLGVIESAPFQKVRRPEAPPVPPPAQASTAP